MSIGTGVVLFVIGAILYFAVHVELSGISLQTVGLILMGAGALVFVLGLVFALRGRRTVASTRVDAAGNRTTRSAVTDDDRI